MLDQRFPKDAIAILLIVGLTALLGYLQESRAQLALRSLRDTGPAPGDACAATASGSGCPSDQLVPGDLIRLESGDRVPADARLLEGSELGLQEAALTGEADLVSKRPSRRWQPTRRCWSASNCLFLGTEVGRGRGLAVVTATGMATALGRHRHADPHRPPGADAPAATAGGPLQRGWWPGPWRWWRRWCWGAGCWAAPPGPAGAGPLHRGGDRAGGAAGGDHGEPGDRHPADGAARRPDPPPAGGGGPGLDHGHLHRQDRHPHPEPPGGGRSSAAAPRPWPVSGDGYDPHGDFSAAQLAPPAGAAERAWPRERWTCCCRPACSAATPSSSRSTTAAGRSGDPTEGALVEAAARAGLDGFALRSQLQARGGDPLQLRAPADGGLGEGPRRAPAGAPGGQRRRARPPC